MRQIHPPRRLDNLPALASCLAPFPVVPLRNPKDAQPSVLRPLQRAEHEDATILWGIVHAAMPDIANAAMPGIHSLTSSQNANAPPRCA